jgi:SAM-dependent methyltransferase
MYFELINTGDKKMEHGETKKMVKQAYGKIATSDRGCGCDTCGPDANDFAKTIGYSDDELKIIPTESNLALSCGNPTALAGLKEGETVLDLGSGAGFDCFLAAAKVGNSGKVIGVDMTPEMIEKASINAEKHGVKNVEFRLGDIETLPVEDNSIDVVISNCVINLSPDKEKVFHEVYRVLKPGGRVAISDIALRKELPLKIMESINAYIGCISGAEPVDDYKSIVQSAGLKNVTITEKGVSCCVDPDTQDPIGRALLDSLGDKESIDDFGVSIYIEGRKE